jgi:hypothetical protein
MLLAYRREFDMEQNLKKEIVQLHIFKSELFFFASNWVTLCENGGGLADISKNSWVFQD